jgi:hypothetical protein
MTNNSLQENQTKWIWVFCSSGQFPCGVFESFEQANIWIMTNKISGCLTRYPLGEGIYDYAIRKSFFSPKKEYQFTSKFKSQFSCASLEHYHYEFDEITGTLINDL